MGAKKKERKAQYSAILHDYMSLIEQDPHNRVTTFFNLLYLQAPPHFVLSNNPLDTLKENLEKQTLDVYEACAILFACNEQNIEMFVKIPSFLALCEVLCQKFHALPAKACMHYIQYVQASILHYLDSKAMRAVLKHIKTLREHGIINLHDQKCMEAAMQIEQIPQNPVKNNTNNIPSFIQLIPTNTILKNQFHAIIKVKKILKKVAWAHKLLFLCEEDFTKKVIILGAQKTGKSTLLAAMLHDDKKSLQANMPLEAKAPITYIYGKSQALVTYLHLSDLQSLQESPVANMAQTYKELQERFHDCLKLGAEKIKHEKLHDSIFADHKIQIASHICVPQDYEILRFVHFINTPSLVPTTFRHLQIYEYTTQSDIVLYLVSYEEIMANLYDKTIMILSRLLQKPHITHVYCAITHIDKTNITIKKQHILTAKIQAALEQKLICKPAQKQKILQNLSFHFITAGIAYQIRQHDISTLESGFDIATSGIIELESALFSHIFDTKSTHHNIAYLRILVALIEKKKAQRDSIKPNESTLKQHLQDIKILGQKVLKKLPGQYYSFYNSFANLRDNLYAEFIQALNYETKKRAQINMQKLKNSMIESLIIGLRSLSQIMQELFFSIEELHTLTTLLDPNNTKSLAGFTQTKDTNIKEHKELLELLFTRYKQIMQADFFGDSNAIVIEHLSYRLDILLPNSMKKAEIQEDSVIKPLKESFDYYFLLLERNIHTLFHNKIHIFAQQLEQLISILESCFLDYFHDDGEYSIEDSNKLIAMLTEGK